MKRQRVDDVLREAGSQDAPSPRPEFVREVEARFGSTRVVTVPASSRRARWAIAGGAAAVIIGGALVLTQSDHGDQGVTTLPTAATTSTTEVGSTSTAVDTTSTSTPDASSTVAPPPPQTSTSTTVAPTTTTTAVATQDLGLHCSTRADTTAVVCEWSASADPAFDHFRLWKHTGDGPDQEAYTGTGTRFEDHELSGARKYYEVTALAADGRVLGHGEMYVVCC